MSHTYSRIILFHGFNATVEDHWFPWLAQEFPTLERISLPETSQPTAEGWIGAATRAIGQLEESTAVITHSLGGITALRAIQRLAQQEAREGEHDEGDHRAQPRLGSLIAVAPFAEALPPHNEHLDPQLPSFLDGLDLPLVAQCLVHATVIRSDNDPVVPPEASDRVAAALNAHLVVTPDAGHFCASEGITTLPAVRDALTL